MSPTRKENLQKAGVSCSEEEWESLKSRYNYICLCCGKRKPLTKDHIIPVSYESSSNNIYNMQPLCEKCNLLKSDHVIDFRYNLSSILPEAYRFFKIIPRVWRPGKNDNIHFYVGQTPICLQSKKKEKKSKKPKIGSKLIIPKNNLCPKCADLVNIDFK